LVLPLGSGKQVKGTVEELASSKMNGKTTDSLHASAVGTVATYASSVPTDWKKK
jgi:hypothetical protein